MIAFVHGVPETASIWDEVRAAVDEESVALALPGFATARPPGFAATKEAYEDWVVGELEELGEPVHLVGHDWGAAFVYRIATAHGHLLRSWVADVGNIAHPDYQWHDVAKLWQTPGDGEAFVAAQAASPPEARAPLFEAMGVPAASALSMTSSAHDDMGACILDLYRSATPNPHADWGPWAPTSSPGLVLHPSDDPFSDEGPAREVATALGARFEVLEGAGHFWPYQAPARAAALLTSFWASLPHR